MLPTLYLIPSSLGDDDAKKILTTEALQIIYTIDEFIVENEKSARKFLKAAGITIPQSQLTIHELDKHQANVDIMPMLKNCLAGKAIGLLSEAGAPAVADPGALVVAKAHETKIIVKPLIGPSSILLSLMASGMNGQQFCFLGYLPREKDLLHQKIKLIEKESRNKNQTQLFIETPYRNNNLLDELLFICDTHTKLCIAANITLQNEFIQTKSIKEWRKLKPNLNKQPSVFLLYAS